MARLTGLYFLRVILILINIFILFLNAGHSLFVGAIIFDELFRGSNILGLNQDECVACFVTIIFSWLSLLLYVIKIYSNMNLKKTNFFIIILLLISFSVSAKINSLDHSYIFFYLTFISIILIKIVKKLPA